MAQAHDLGERAIATIERQGWLDPLADALARGVAAAFRSGGAAARKLKNVLHGTWLGHPLHPALTDVPIGAFAVALVLDTLDDRKGRRYGAGADAAIVTGLAGAVAAAMTGITDWQHTDAGARRTGLVHGSLNTLATILYGTSLVLRRRGARDEGRAVALGGFATLLASAYLGGALVYHHRIGVDHAPDGAGPHGFVPVLSASELHEGRPQRVELDGIPVVLVRRGDRIAALAETCAHLGGPLSEGTVEDGSIVCPWHGSRFALDDGRVLDGPATFPEPCFEARIRAGHIEVGRRLDVRAAEAA